MEIKKAVRSNAKVKIALCGVSGSGKTYSALQMAKGMGDKILVVDTENGSASLYADSIPGGFDVIELKPPYKTEQYIEAIDAAIANKYDVVVLDSISHAWAGEGGLLQQKEALDATGKGNGYTNWGSMTKKHEAFVAKILHSDINIIATMRSKTEYALTDVNGKKVPQKVGMAPIQRDGVEYEFTLVFDININHTAQVSKSRTTIFSSDEIFKITTDTGKTIMKWIATGVDVPKPKEEPKETPKAEKPKAEKPADPSYRALIMNELYRTVMFEADCKKMLDPTTAKEAKSALIALYAEKLKAKLNEIVSTATGIVGVTSTKDIPDPELANVLELAKTLPVPK